METPSGAVAVISHTALPGDWYRSRCRNSVLMSCRYLVALTLWHRAKLGRVTSQLTTAQRSTAQHNFV